jgi:hypothetical protein
MPTVNFIGAGGVTREVAAHAGRSVMEAAIGAGAPGIVVSTRVTCSFRDGGGGGSQFELKTWPSSAKDHGKGESLS